MQKTIGVKGYNARNTNEEPIKKVIKKMLESFGFDEEIHKRRAIAAWPAIVGEYIAQHTTDLYLKNHKLYVHLDNAALKSELSYAKSRIMEAINKHIEHNEVHEIILR